MAKQVINNGTSAGDGTGESLYDAFGKCINNFDDLYQFITDLADTASGNGASDVGVYDEAGNLDATNVEAALAEIFTKFASQANGKGASLIGIEDAATNFGATDVEAALAEIISDLADSTSALNGAVKVGLYDNATNFTATNVEAALAEIANNYLIKAVAQGYTATKNFTATTLSDGASIAWDLAANQVCKVTLAGDRTLANPTNMVDGGTYILRVIQDATGDRTLDFGTAYDWLGKSAPTLNTSPNSVTILTFVSDGVSMYGMGSDDGYIARLDVAQEYTATQNFNATALTSSAGAIAWDLAANQVVTHTATENTTLSNPTNQAAGATYIMIWTQHASSPKTLDFGTAYKFPGGTTPVVTATVDAVDILSFVSDGTYMYGMMRGDFS